MQKKGQLAQVILRFERLTCHQAIQPQPLNPRLEENNVLSMPLSKIENEITKELVPGTKREPENPWL